jgi:hypothetical protein
MALCDSIARNYAAFRRPDRRIASALGDAASVVNIGVGSGSYEPSLFTSLFTAPDAEHAVRLQALASLSLEIDGANLFPHLTCEDNAHPQAVHPIIHRLST